MTKRGKITPNGVILKTHEYATIVFLTELGFDISCIPKSNVEGVHSPDIRISNIRWEMKSPTGEGKYLISNTIQRAIKQSPNIIIDLRRAKRHETKCLRELQNEFAKSKSLKRLKIITKRGKVIDFVK